VRGFLGIEVDSLCDAKVSSCKYYETIEIRVERLSAKVYVTHLHTIQDESIVLATFAQLYRGQVHKGVMRLPEEYESWVTYIRYPLKKDCNSPSVVAYARFPM
jgi:hypothetical protein